MFLLWVGLAVAAMFTEPESNRAYAETWRQAPASELLEAQDEKPRILPRSDGIAGRIYRYQIGPWRGFKGRTYPGPVFNRLFGDRPMYSGMRFVTARAGAYCDIDFMANAAGVIEAITYSGNDCD
ncbi:hypothetical protein [Dongia sedimenti]|uniref:Uncharacterized protein n=1 Tax=Dongia sedimenti TaxID=3064282 RepID=A0ABU0YFU4_9PROT|nr:hypothetical protein [Rhodospirillaceae bacterium R-7]